MPEIVFIEHNGIEHRVQGQLGKSLMQCAIDHMVPGILAECGGNCSCATCHGYIEPRWLGMLSPPSDTEVMAIEGALDADERSRLTCQIELTEALDGVVVRLPRSQT